MKALLLFLAFLGMAQMPPRQSPALIHDAVTDAPPAAAAVASVAPSQSRVRAAIIAAAMADIGVREETGRNDGQRVNAMQRNAGIKVGTAKSTGDPWCVAAVYTWYSEGCRAAGVANPMPRTGYSPTATAGGSRDIDSAQVGDVGGIYNASLGRIAHVVLFRAPAIGGIAPTIEGNTDATGGREGDGVYVRVRAASSIRLVKRWLK